MKFFTVDMDPENTLKFNRKYKTANSGGISMKGEEFLKLVPFSVDFLYLDAFDISLPGHSEKRRAKYRRYLGTGITDVECHKMHLECVKNSWRKISKGGLVCFDDIFDVLTYEGKGQTAIPYLLRRGFVVLEYLPNSLILTRPKSTVAGFMLSFSQNIISGIYGPGRIKRKVFRWSFKLARKLFIKDGTSTSLDGAEFHRR